MTKLVAGVLNVVSSLSAKDRKQFVRGLLDSGLLSEDEQDRITIESRRRDPTTPLSDFVREMKRKGRFRRPGKSICRPAPSASLNDYRIRSCNESLIG